MKRLLLVGFCVLSALSSASGGEPNAVVNIWPGKPPGDERKLDKEQDFTKPTDNPVGGGRIIKLGNVSTPQIHVFLPPKEKRNGTAVVICPGGGFSILAWDLEGTEVADWLNSIGVAAVVLKYRVPTGGQKQSWLMPMQDAQRAVSLTRAKAKEWDIAPDQIGILGFSAGGHTAARAAVIHQRAYEPVDDSDKASCRPDFGILVYPWMLIDDKAGALKSEFALSKETPPLFFIHAADDPIPCENSVQLFLAARKNKTPAELHVFEKGGHGYGLRPVKDQPVTAWPKLCEEWMKKHGFVKAK